MAKAKKYFVLMEKGADTDMVFHNAQPRGAALKAASRGHTSIRLRERGTKRVHVFNGWREETNAPANRPSWLPSRIWKANVKKVGVERVSVDVDVSELFPHRLKGRVQAKLRNISTDKPLAVFSHVLQVGERNFTNLSIKIPMKFH